LTPSELDLAPLVHTLRLRPDELNDEYEHVFGLMLAKKCPPYETEYCPQTFSVYRSQALADVAGFYRAFGVGPSRDTPERADHIALELEYLAFLIAKESSAADPAARDTCRDAQRRFVQDHLGWWVPAFARALQRQAERVLGRAPGQSGFYPALARALAAFISAERAVLAVDPPTELVAPGPVEPPEEMSCQDCGLHEVSVGGGRAGG
jgi:TorA maturation chaperone TorD